MDLLSIQTQTEKKSLKVIITEKILSELNSTSEPLNKTINDWWYTKSSDGLRLTIIGDEMFRKAEIQFFDLPIPKTIMLSNWHPFLINCSRKLKCPYYIGLNKNTNVDAKLFIRLYDERTAILVSLYGNISSYLESIRGRK